MTNLPDPLENSKALFEKAKAFFTAKNRPDCVIEISEKPFEEWTVHLTSTDEEMTTRRRILRRAQIPFISIYKDEDGTHIFFNDKSMLLLQVVETGEIRAFMDRSFDNYELDEVRKEFLELKKILQGK